MIPDNFVWSWADVSEDIELFEAQWDITNLQQTRRFGKSWVDSRRSLALRVPSVIVPQTLADFNILLNPTHHAYGEIDWQHGGKFAFDPRLFSD